MIRRPPRSTPLYSSAASDVYKRQSWEATKKKEKNRDSVLEGVPKSLPALLQSRRIQEKAADVGFDWEKNSQVIAKVDEEIAELKDAIKIKKGINEEFGDVLFSLVNLLSLIHI